MARRKIIILLFSLLLTSSVAAIDRAPIDSSRHAILIEPPFLPEFQPYSLLGIGCGGRIDERERLNQQLSLTVRAWYFVQKNNAVKFGLRYYPSLQFKPEPNRPGEKVKVYSLETGIRWGGWVKSVLGFVEAGFEYRQYVATIANKSEPRIGLHGGAGFMSTISDRLSTEFSILYTLNNIASLTTSDFISGTREPVGIQNGRFADELFNPIEIMFFLLYRI